jgi:hypothetical protein
MKTLFSGLLAISLLSRAAAQVSIEQELEQEQFLPSESVRVAVKITNRSGQMLHLGADPDWLTFNVENSDGFVVIKKNEVPVAGEFDLESSQMAIKRVDLQPYFAMTKPGRYKVIATLRIKDWSSQIASPPKHFDLISGVLLWEQDFGVPSETTHVPEARKYSLLQANYLKEQLRLYVQVSDAKVQQVYKVVTLGPMVSFGRPEAQVDRNSRLNVLWQTGAQAFSFSVVNPDGTLAQQEIFDAYNSRPRMTVDENGKVTIRGGIRRMKTSEYPAAVMPPNEVPPPTPPASTNSY